MPNATLRNPEDCQQPWEFRHLEKPETPRACMTDDRSTLGGDFPSEWLIIQSFVSVSEDVFVIQHSLLLGHELSKLRS